jgi:Xaa-Pro aminopeptidase
MSDGDIGRMVVSSRGWWSAWRRAAGPLLGALTMLNITNFFYELDTNRWWTAIDAVLAAVSAAILAVWYVRGRDEDAIAREGWMLLGRTFGPAARGMTVTITPVTRNEWGSFDIKVRITRAAD